MPTARVTGKTDPERDRKAVILLLKIPNHPVFFAYCQYKISLYLNKTHDTCVYTTYNTNTKSENGLI